MYTLYKRTDGVETVLGKGLSLLQGAALIDKDSMHSEGKAEYELTWEDVKNVEVEQGRD